MMLDKNILILKARFPDVYKRIIEVGTREPLHFRYGDGNSSTQLLSVNGKHTFPSFSDGRKDELIEVWFNNLRLQSEAIYSITGFGDGSHIRYFLKNSSGGNYCAGCGKRPSITKGDIFEAGLQSTYSPMTALF